MNIEKNGETEAYAYGNRARKDKPSCINFDRVRSKIISTEQGGFVRCWNAGARNLYSYLFECIYYEIILKNIKEYAQQLREFKNKKMMEEEFKSLDYYEKRDVLTNKLGIEMLQPVLFFIGFKNSSGILEAILKRLEEMDRIKQFQEKSMCTKKHLSNKYECALSIGDIARDLRIIGIEFGFTVIHRQLPIIIGLFLEHVMIDFLNELDQHMQKTYKNPSKKISIQDIVHLKNLVFSGLVYTIPMGEELLAECMLKIPKTSIDLVERINNFSLPTLKKRNKKLPERV